MANTAMMQLLARLNGGAPGAPNPAPSAPIPLAPVGNLGPLSMDTTAAQGALNPEPPLPRIVQPGPIDTSFVDAYSGQAPVAPVQRKPSKLEIIAGVLSGIGGGPEYALALREQRERPFRDYQRQTEQYQDRRSRAIELAERRSEREAEQANRALEAAYERDYRVWLKKNDFRDDASKEAMRQAFIRERDIRAERLEVDRELKREQRAREVEARQITERYFTATRNRPLSAELGRYYAGLTDRLSPAAVKLDRAVQGVGEVRMNRAVNTGGGRVGVSNAATKALANFNGALQEVIGAVSRGDIRGEQMARRKLDAMYGRLSQFPGQIERGIGTGGWPYAKPVGQGAPAPAGQQPQQQPQADPLKIR